MTKEPLRPGPRPNSMISSIALGSGLLLLLAGCTGATPLDADDRPEVTAEVQGSLGGQEVSAKLQCDTRRTVRGVFDYEAPDEDTTRNPDPREPLDQAQGYADSLRLDYPDAKAVLIAQGSASQTVAVVSDGKTVGLLDYVYLDATGWRDVSMEACSPNGQGSAFRLPTSDWQIGDPAELARLSGRVALGPHGCLVVSRHLVLWPKGFTATIQHDETVHVFDGTGTEVARTGSKISAGGGFGPPVDSWPCGGHYRSMFVMQSMPSSED